MYSSISKKNRKPVQIPPGTLLFGKGKNGNQVILVVTEGDLFIGNKSYNSLSAAAEAISGVVRKSGWAFWKTADGRTAKEAFKNG
jgi:hypothetical protein